MRKFEKGDKILFKDNSITYIVDVGVILIQFKPIDGKYLAFKSALEWDEKNQHWREKKDFVGEM